VGQDAAEAALMKDKRHRPKFLVMIPVLTLVEYRID
jgi:hypothetical protein